MIPELENAQMKAIEIENANAMKRIRKLQVELDELRQSNSKMLESMMKNVNHENIETNLSIITGSWFGSYCALQIFGINSKIEQMKRNHKPEDSILKKQLEEVRIKNAELQENKKSLILELRSLQEEINQEKEELRKYIANEMKSQPNF